MEEIIMGKYLRLTDCSECGGTGTVECPECMGSGIIVGVGTCHVCGGSGEVYCPHCDGSGKESVEYEGDEY